MRGLGDLASFIMVVLLIFAGTLLFTKSVQYAAAAAVIFMVGMYILLNRLKIV